MVPPRSAIALGDVGEPEALPQEVVDEQARLDLGLASHPIHGASDAPPKGRHLHPFNWIDTSARLLSDLQSPQSANGVADRLRQLTERQTEILRLVAEGLSNKEVALRLELQEKTVKHHMTGVLSKLNVRNRTEAALMMREFRDRDRNRL